MSLGTRWSQSQMHHSFDLSNQQASLGLMSMMFSPTDRSLTLSTIDLAQPMEDLDGFTGQVHGSGSRNFLGSTRMTMQEHLRMSSI